MISSENLFDKFMLLFIKGVKLKPVATCYCVQECDATGNAM